MRCEPKAGSVDASRWDVQRKAPSEERYEHEHKHEEEEDGDIRCGKSKPADEFTIHDSRFRFSRARRRWR